MKVLVKKFTLVRNGVIFKAGEVVDLPDEEALRLTRESIKEFGLLTEAMPDAKIIKEPEKIKTALSAEFEAMTVEQLKNYAVENGIDLGKTSKKADIINLLMAVEAGDEGEDSLPAVDAGALVK